MYFLRKILESLVSRCPAYAMGTFMDQAVVLMQLPTMDIRSLLLPQSTMTKAAHGKGLFALQFQRDQIASWRRSNNWLKHETGVGVGGPPIFEPQARNKIKK